MAFEALQRAWSEQTTLHRDERCTLVDKPAGVACLGSTPEFPSWDLVERLLAHGVAELEPVLPLPLAASGMVLLVPPGAAPAARAAVAAGKLPPPLETLGYVAGVEDCSLAPQGRLPLGPAGSPSVEYQVWRRRGPRALLKVRAALLPEHLVAALAAAGQVVVGTEPVPSATRWLLHIERAQGSGIDASAQLPLELESWLAGEPQGTPQQFEGALRRAAMPRARLIAEQEAQRLLAEGAGEIAGINVDRYGAYAVLELSSEEAWSERERLAECLLAHGARGVYLKRRLRTDLRKRERAELAPSLPVRGAAAPDALCVRNASLAFWVRLGDGLGTGLFLDQRQNWERVVRSARGATLLNLFSHTGAFSVAAGAGGAVGCTSVDLSKRALSRLAENLELNGLSGPTQRLLPADVLQWLARARRSQQRFGWIVLDPPSFGTRRGGVLRTESSYQELVADCVELLSPGGALLCVSHQRGLSAAELTRLVQKAIGQRGRSGRVATWLGGWDAASLPGVSSTKSVLAQLE
jgi:23S rRNA G2069 N7-methylase RlmK/C1962 C5-methylase RlmI